MSTSRQGGRALRLQTSSAALLTWAACAHGAPPAPSATQEPAGLGGDFTVDSSGLGIHCARQGAGPIAILPSPGWEPSLELYQRADSCRW